MPLDGLHGDRDERPERILQHSAPVNDAEAPAKQPAELRTRTEYCEALRAADRGAGQADRNPRQAGLGADLQADPETERHPRTSAWDTVAAENRPRCDSIHVSPERAGHILDGDRWGGGHRHGTGRPGKTEFPAHWDDKRVIDRIMDMARFPDSPPVLQANQRWRAQGERDGVAMTVIVRLDGRIWTAWPHEGSPGVIRNPGKGER
jgi:Bacterial EndoU nuclease